MDRKVKIPFSVLRRIFINELNELINNCGLEPYMIESILKDAYERMAVMTEQQYKRELAIYQQSIKDDESKEDCDG